MCEPATIAAIATAVAAAASASQQGYKMAQGTDTGPDPAIAAKASADAADKARLSSVVRRTTPDALTRTSGGASPEFLANVATQEAGTPGLQNNALDMVKQLLSQGGGL